MSSQKPSGKWEWIRLVQLRDIIGGIQFELARLSVRIRPELVSNWEQELNEAVTAYLNHRDYHFGKSNDFKILDDVAILLIDLSRRGKLFVRGSPKIGIRIGTRLLVDKGWLAAKPESEILRELRELDLNRPGVLGDVVPVLKNSFFYQGETIGRGFEDVRSWGSQQEWWGVMEEDFRSAIDF